MHVFNPFHSIVAALAARRGRGNAGNPEAPTEDQPIVGAAQDSTAPAPEPAAAKPIDFTPLRLTQPAPIRGRVSLLESLDLSDFHTIDPDLQHREGGQATRKAKERIDEQAQRIRQSLRRRRPILDNLARTVHDLDELGKLISEDRPLAAQVLKTVNSPYYGLLHPAKSTQQAVHLLGHTETRNIVWRTCVSDVVGTSNRLSGELIAKLWQHSFTAARVAEAMAKSLRIPRPEDISLAALLHDIGKFISLSVWPGWTQASYLPLRFSDRQRLANEKKHLHLDHAELGAHAVKSWGLPTELCTTIQQHHAPIYQPPIHVVGNRRAIITVHLSDALCHIAEPYLAGREICPVSLPVKGWMAVLGVRDDLAAVCSEGVILALLPPAVDRRDPFLHNEAA